MTWKLLKKPDGNPVSQDGCNFITVTFTDGENKSIDQNYPIGTEKQRYFDLLIMHIGLDNTKQVHKKEVVGKRVWVAIKEVFLSDSVIMKNPDGSDKKEYYVFKTFKYDGEKSYPIVKGDPKNFDGVPQDEFVDYVNTWESPKEDENPMSTEKPAF